MKQKIKSYLVKLLDLDQYATKESIFEICDGTIKTFDDLKKELSHIKLMVGQIEWSAEKEREYIIKVKDLLESHKNWLEINGLLKVKE
jgi:hypothetical protein